MLDAAVRAENFQPHLKAKSAAQPVDGRQSIVIEKRYGNAWPASR
jgi:hypothetical protein